MVAVHCEELFTDNVCLRNTYLRMRTVELNGSSCLRLRSIAGCASKQSVD